MCEVSPLSHLAAASLPSPSPKPLTMKSSPREEDHLCSHSLPPLPPLSMDCNVASLPTQARLCLKQPLEKKVIYPAIQYSLDAIMAFYKIVCNASCRSKKIYYSDPERLINPHKVQVFLLKRGLIPPTFCFHPFLGDRTCNSTQAPGCQIPQSLSKEAPPPYTSRENGARGSRGPLHSTCSSDNLTRCRPASRAQGAFHLSTQRVLHSCIPSPAFSVACPHLPKSYPVRSVC